MTGISSLYLAWLVNAQQKIYKTFAVQDYGHVYIIWSYYKAKIKLPIFFYFRPGHVPLILLPGICKLFNLVMDSELFLESWNVTFWIPLYKSGNPDDCDNYRCIAVVVLPYEASYWSFLAL